MEFQNKGKSENFKNLISSNAVKISTLIKKRSSISASRYTSRNMMKKVCGSSQQKDDRITSLPEPIRTKVISFLPMEDVIRASILSREWRIDVERFNISVKAEGSTKYHIRAWILFAIRNNVREFHLNIVGGSFMGFPCCFFQCSTVVELSLSGLSLEVPPNVCFPKLKRFSLFHGEITNDNLTKSLFSGCSAIEEFTLERCLISTWRTITISSPSLKILTLFLSSDPVTEIKIHATSLQKIENRYSQLPTISSETLCSLLRVDFSLDTLSDVRDCRQNSILIGLRNVARLCLRDMYIMAISGYSNSLESLPSSCSSLKHLELEIGPIQPQVNVLVSLLNIYTNLVTLHVSFPVTSLSKYAPTVQMDSQQFISKHLNTVEVKDFEGSDAELVIVEYILENASALEKLKITCFDTLKDDATAHMMVSEELSTVAKASSRAILLFD